VTREQGEQLTSIEMRINQMLPEYQIEGFQPFRPRAPRPHVKDEPAENRAYSFAQ
jgi:hypothetical protein